MSTMRRIQVIDSHTGGEPTRLVLSGAPDLGTGPLAERAKRLTASFDDFRSAVVNEPRGPEAMVGALLVEPHAPDCEWGVIFFNTVGVLGMCGHGTIGVVATLAHLGRLSPGTTRIDTPAGVVTATLHEDGAVSVENVPSYRRARAVGVSVPGAGRVTGDVAYGGNWFYLSEDHGQEIARERVAELADYCRRVRRVVREAGYPEVDHIGLFAPGRAKGADARNFVLCPGGAYDRSPCGTGTSARVACLAADGRLAEGAVWTQESVIGSVFRATYRREGERVVPTITGRAHVTAEATLLVDPTDLLGWGIR